MTTQRRIYVTARDFQRLDDLLSIEQADNFRDRNDLKALATELRSAQVVDSREIPPDVVTMNTRLVFRDLEDGQCSEVTLVFPDAANIDDGRISVISPIGTALLGYARGDTIEWTVPAGTRRLRIEQILFQPEAAGRLDL